MGDIADIVDDSFEEDINHIVTMDAMLDRGLQLFFTKERIVKAKKGTNIDRFVKKFGVDPVTACKLYEWMQRTKVDDARIAGSPKDLKSCLMSLHFLRKYPTESDMESLFDYSPKYVSGLVWKFVTKICALKEEVIRFPQPDEMKNDIWIMSVDGTHVWIQEPTHDELSQDPKYFSKKIHHAGMTFELGVSLTGGLIWINGPFPAGTNDIRVFRKPGGLKEKLQALGKMAIGDRGYRGEPDLISFFNPEDSKGVAKFKCRALMRHEVFNWKIKTFEALRGRFRHSKEKLAIAFKAICVISQLKLETDMPLFDILIQQVLDKELGLGTVSDDEDSDEDSDDDSE
jgi:hypothetical protein